MTRSVSVQKQAQLCLIGLLPFAYAAVVCFTIEAWGEGPTDGRDTGQVGVFADSDGAIAEILIQFDSGAVDEVAPVYSDLFRQLPGDVRISVISSSADAIDEFVGRWGDLLSAGGHEVVVIDVDRPISIWARDRQVSRHDVLTYEPHLAFIPSESPVYGEGKLNDLDVLRAMSRAGILPSTMPESVHLEGGNVVANGRHVFIGANVLEENEWSAEEHLFGALRQIAGRPIIFVADDQGAVPWCHVDMYLTPLDEQDVLVASTNMGLALLDRAGLSEGESPQVGIDRSVRIGQGLDEIADRLTQAGYTVHRLPALFSADGEWMITYNNVLLDRRSGQRTVFMPVYGVTELDDRSFAAYTELGWDVRPVDVTGVFRDGGTVRCLVNVTRRRPEWEAPDTHANPDRPRAIQRWRLRDLEIDNGINDALIRLAMCERRPQYPHRPRARVCTQ